MATSHNAFAADAPHSSEFETRRAALVNDIGESLEQVLTHINALNRSLEGIIEIGNEFASVEALWSQFETVMGREEEVAQNPSTQDDTEESRVEHDRASRG
ncbi:hypothetical protein PV08_04087 [Exophiala spinifera]|uniref:DASH complex subunit DAD1 n=1 Tax=Exophiala spinifera TaxID=91928 RepID=A0A0D1ZW32_9EURO|nr:uncharacterized protein PV08_04087 [Exophiala spinifera]KIW16897.1 hypothetical protein PV08_04087 [Exophiala spinifera]